VVGLVEWRRQGVTDEQLQAMFDLPLTQADLDTAWDYYANHMLEIEQRLWEERACMVESRPIPAALLVEARRLAMPDDRIRDAFHPPLTHAELEAVWE
jgi:uncharacterized protein (DUF433 family)